MLWRYTVLVPLLLLQGCFTALLWRDGAAATYPVLFTGLCRIEDIRANEDGSLVAVQLRVLDEGGRDAFRSLMGGDETLLSCEPDRAQAGLWRLAREARADVGPLAWRLGLESARTASGASDLAIVVRWTGILPAIDEGEAPDWYEHLESVQVRRQEELVSLLSSFEQLFRNSGFRVWGDCVALAWLDREGNELRTLSSGTTSGAGSMDASLLVRLGGPGRERLYLRVPVPILQSVTRLDGTERQLRWAIERALPARLVGAESEAGALDLRVPLSREASFVPFRHTELRTESSFWPTLGKVLLTPLTVTLDVTLFVFYVWLESGIEDLAEDEGHARTRSRRKSDSEPGARARTGKGGGSGAGPQKRTRAGRR